MLEILVVVLIALAISLVGFLASQIVYDRKKKKVEKAEKNKKRKTIVPRPALMMPLASSVVALAMLTFGICVMLVLNLMGISL